MRRDVNQVYYNVRRLSQIARSRALRALRLRRGVVLLVHVLHVIPRMNINIGLGRAAVDRADRLVRAPHAYYRIN